MTAVFWTAVGLVAYVYVGYPLLLFLASRIWSRPVRKQPITPDVTMIIAAYNEEQAIAAKLENTLALTYPRDKLEILVASDGSSDRTNEIIEQQYAGRVKLLALPRAGKTSAQNHAAEVARGEILVFSDATTIYDRDALAAMVTNYADPSVGSVSSNPRYVLAGEDVSGKGRKLYWDYENSQRRWETRIYSVLGGTGCFYSLRKRLYVPLDPAAISDFVQPVKSVLQGYRSVVEDGAGCSEITESQELGDELRRRARTILRGMRGVGYMHEILNPLRHPALCFQIVSHRLLRWAVPFFLIAAFVSNAFLIADPRYRVLFAIQVAVYATAVAAWVLERRRLRAPGMFVPLYFCLINLAPLLAVWKLLKGEKKVLWETGPQT